MPCTANSITLSSLALALTLLAGCGESPSGDAADSSAVSHPALLDKANGKTLITVNGYAITSGEFHQWLKRAGVADPTNLPLEQRQVALDELASLNMLAQAAVERGVDKLPEVFDQLVLKRKSLLADKLLEAELAKNPITTAEVEAEYNRRKADMAITQYRARHIVVDDEGLAKTLIAQLNNGADFAALATEHSTESSKNDGGDIGWFELREMLQPFAEEVARLTTGRFSDAPVKSQLGWHIVKLEGRREVPPPALENMQKQLRQLLRAQRVEQLIRRLRADTTVSAATQ